MRNFKKILSLILVAAISTSNVNVAFADYRGVLDYDISSNESSKNHGNVVVYNDGIMINGEFYTKTEFQNLLKTADIIYETKVDLHSGNSEIMPATGLVAGLYFIPGVGEVLITATGVVIVAGAVIAVGSWVYNVVVNYFKEHTKNKSKKNHDKHTKPRPGRDSEKKKQKPEWKNRNPKKRP